MKIQDLAIIFIIIILPISIALSTVTQYQIKTLNTQTLYDSQLTAATHDAIKAYQINAENSTTSELADSKIRDIEASVATFKNSIMSSFRLNGYTEEELDNYIPALVYTMYDGFYMYSPYVNTNHQYEPIKDYEGNITGYNKSKPIQGNGDNQYGLKPYINYSCRYIKGDINVVITYALDNYITVQGMMPNPENGGNVEYVNKSGYLIEGIVVNDNEVEYNGVKIETEALKEYLPIPRVTDNVVPEAYPYIKLNGTKYYKVDLNANIDGDDTIIYLSNGTIMPQCENDPNRNDDDYDKYSNLIDNNSQAKQYYKDAKKFTDWIANSELTSLTYNHAYNYIYNGTEYISTKIWENNETQIFVLGSKINIENELSNFNQHRLEVIRHKIESNLSTAIANYNMYSGATNDFQMPELKENEWNYITHNISLISFLQGLHIGGKVYNGYTIVTNSESEEVVLESNIYILGRERDDSYIYYRIGDQNIGTDSPEVQLDVGFYGGGLESAGRLNLDFKRKMISNNNKVLYYYPLQDYNASYTSIIMQDKVNPYEDIYDYIDDQSDYLKKAFYTALGRERQGKYNSAYGGIK